MASWDSWGIASDHSAHHTSLAVAVAEHTGLAGDHQEADIRSEVAMDDHHSADTADLGRADYRGDHQLAVLAGQLGVDGLPLAFVHSPPPSYAPSIPFGFP
jgi:hypothetical protein